MEWVTTARPHVDRCATAWLIKRFVDPGATFSFVAPGEDPPGGAVPFDLPGAKHGHRGAACTFETVLAEYGLRGDAALVRLAALVHDLDFHKMRRPESAGVDAVLRGLVLAEPDDHRVLAHAGVLFDALYARERALAGGDSG